MAITRIKNNQITNATIDASTKLVDLSITAGKLANNLNYASNLTITGNLSVDGTSTTLDTVNTLIEDPILLLGKDQTGVPAYDLGFVGERGDEDNAVFVWKETATEWQFGTTTGTGDGTTVTLAGFADIQAAGITGTTLALSGNITGPLNVTGSIEASTTITAVGNVAGGNVTTAGAVEATGLISSGTTITATGNVVGGNVTTAGAVEATGLISSGTTITATGNVAGGNVTTAGAVEATGLISSGSTITATGNVAGGNVTTAGQVQADNVDATNGITAGTTVTATGNVAGGNITTAGAMEATGLISSGTTITATGNVAGGNLTTGGDIDATGDIAGGSVTTNIFQGSLPVISSTGTNADISLDPNGTGSIDVNSAKITSLATPTADTDAANKAYVDSIAEGLDIKASCVVATTAVLPAVTYANGTDGVGATLTADANGAFAAVDGVTLATLGQRILVKDQAAALQNGIYQLSTVGDAGSAFVLTRTTDFDNGSPSGEIPGAFTFIEEGTTNEDAGFVCTTNAPVTVGSTAINWTQFSGAGGIVAGLGLSKTGDTLNVEVDDVTTAIVSDEVTVKVSANLTTPNIGVANGDSFTASGIVTATGNVSGGNITTGGAMEATGLISSGTTITATGNVAGGNVTTAGQVQADNVDSTNAIVGGTTITATGNVAGGNITTGGAVEATGLISSGTTITATGNVAGGNVTTGGAMEATGLISSGTTITATGNVAGGNVTTGGRVDATGQVKGASLATGNITIGTDDIDSAGEAITVNQAAADVDFVVEGGTDANLFRTDAGTDTVLVGTGTATADATLKVGGTASQMIPVGTSAERPTSPATGMIRLNTTLDSFEFYDSNSWTTAGSDFTVIASETFNGDNSTVAFTLSTSQTTASCIVSINGVVQLPTDAYGVSTTTLTFTEAPLSGDVIEVRQITTTTTITYISNAAQTASMEALDGQAIVQIKGDLNPIANATQDLGSATSRWNELFLSGSTITLGNVVIKNTGGNSVGFFGPDGTTPGTIDANVEIAGDSIQNGTSLVDFSGSGGDVQITAGGTQSLTALSTGANVIGDFATTGDVRFLDSDNSNYVGFQAPATVGTNLVWTLPATDGTSGQALVSDGSGVLSFAAAGATVTSDTTTNAELLLYVASTTTGALTAVTQDSGLTYNPSTGSLSSAVFIGDLTGTASASTLAADATKLATARAIALSGAVTGTANFDGSAGITIATTATSDPTITLAGDLTGSVTLTNLASGTLTATIAANSVALGTDTTGNYVATGAVSGTGLSGSSSSEGGTFTVTSNATSANTGSTIVARDGSGNFTAGIITATATAARYADLAEKYASDGDIEAGTVVHFAGEGKVAECDIANCRSVAGIVSTDPAYLMNSDADGVALAIAGRVPTKVTGVVNAGDLIVSAGNGRGMANNDAAIGTVIGKAIEANEGGDGVIEVLALMM